MKISEIPRRGRSRRGRCANLSQIARQICVKMPVFRRSVHQRNPKGAQNCREFVAQSSQFRTILYKYPFSNAPFSRFLNFWYSWTPKTGTRAHSPKPPFRSWQVVAGPFWRQDRKILSPQGPRPNSKGRRWKKGSQNAIVAICFGLLGPFQTMIVCTEIKQNSHRIAKQFLRRYRFLSQRFGVATPAEPRGEKKLNFVQILGGEKLLNFCWKVPVKYF